MRFPGYARLDHQYDKGDAIRLERRAGVVRPDSAESDVRIRVLKRGSNASSARSSVSRLGLKYSPLATGRRWSYRRHALLRSPALRRRR